MVRRAACPAGYALAAIEPMTNTRNQVTSPIGETINGRGERKDIIPIM